MVVSWKEVYSHVKWSTLRVCVPQLALLCIWFPFKMNDVIHEQFSLLIFAGTYFLLLSNSTVTNSFVQSLLHYNKHHFLRGVRLSWGFRSTSAFYSCCCTCHWVKGSLQKIESLEKEYSSLWLLSWLHEKMQELVKSCMEPYRSWGLGCSISLCVLTLTFLKS